jgi:hypothetical protein
MAIIRQITCISKRNYYFDPHEIIESVGGEYQGSAWYLPDYMAIHFIKKDKESYYVMAGSQKLKIVVAVYRDKEYLKAETDGYSPDTLLALPLCMPPMSVIR